MYSIFQIYWCAVLSKQYIILILYIDFSINRLCTENRLICYHNGPQHCTKLKSIDRFGDKNHVKSSDFNAWILTFPGKLDHQFSHVWMFGDMFPQSQFRYYAGYKPYQRYMFQFIRLIISEGRRNCGTFWSAQQRNRDCQETCYQI